MPKANDKIFYKEIEHKLESKHAHGTIWNGYYHETIPWYRGIGPPPTWLNAWVCFALQRRRAESEGARRKATGEGGRRRGLRNQRRVGRRETVGRDGGGGAVVPHGWVGGQGDQHSPRSPGHSASRLALARAFSCYVIQHHGDDHGPDGLTDV